MKVEQIMSEHPVFVKSKTPAHEAKALADAKGVHYLLLVDADNDLRGITCLCDIARAGVNDNVGSFARAPVTYVTAGQEVDFAAEIMRDCAVGCLPVLQNPGAIVGVLTRRDLIEAGLLPNAPHCASCGTTHDLVEQAGSATFCRSCLESTPPPGTVGRRWYCTLGDGD